MEGTRRGARSADSRPRAPWTRSGRDTAPAADSSRRRAGTSDPSGWLSGVDTQIELWLRVRDQRVVALVRHDPGRARDARRIAMTRVDRIRLGAQVRDHVMPLPRRSLVTHGAHVDRRDDDALAGTW